MRKLNDDDKAGLYITIIIHLVVLIVMLGVQVGIQLKKDNSYLIDFSRQEEDERQRELERRLAEDEEYGEAINKLLDDMIKGKSGIEFRNISVDRATLKDDRGTDAAELYKEAERLANELNSGFTVDEPDDSYAAVAPEKREEKKEAEYTGPSVVSYELEGRKASHLAVPAYKCYGGGMVTVIIGVDNGGNVVSAKIQDEISSDDSCLRDYAIRAARLSKFSASPTAPARQGGSIVYQFIAQR